MKDLIRRILREEVDRKELETKIHRWEGDIEDDNVANRIKNIQAKLQLKMPIDDEDYNFFENFLKQEVEKRKKSIDTMSQKIKRTKENFFNPPTDQKKKIMELGKQAYLELLKTNLSIFFNASFNPNLKLEIGKPGEQWFKENLEQLTTFEQDIKEWKNNYVYWTEGPRMTIENKIEELKSKLLKKDWFGIIENKDWSILNHLSTHYTFWAEEISQRQQNGDLPMGGGEDVIQKYFQKRRIDSTLPKKWFPILDKLKKEKNVIVDRISMAHVDLLEKFHEEKEEDYKKMVEKIVYTTTLGEKAEKNFLTLIEAVPSKVTEIKKYSTWGNVVDIVFGVDMTAKFIDGLKFIQVKSNENNAKKAFIKNLKVPYLLVFPGVLKREGELRKRKKTDLSFLYYSNKNSEEPRSFNQDFIDTKDDIPGFSWNDYYDKMMSEKN